MRFKKKESPWSGCSENTPTPQLYTMPIRMIAQELYRLIRDVERLEKELKNVPFEQQANIKDLLRKAKAERDRVRAILDGKKEQ